MNTSARRMFGGLVCFAGVLLGCGMLLGLIVWNALRPRPSDFLLDLLGNALFLGGAALGAWLYRVGRRMGQESAAEATARDSRPPILLLRSFSDDHSLRVRRSGLLAMLTGRFTGQAVGFEEVLVRVFAAHGPVLAIGRPGEALPPIGAARAYIPAGGDWKEEVRALAQRSAWIVMVLGSSEGFRWELDMVLGLGSPEKVVIALPPLTDESLQPRWEALRREFRNHGRELPPAFDPEAVLLSFSKHWEPVFSLGRGLIRIGWLGSGAKQYERHLRDALAGVAGQTLPKDDVATAPASTAPSPTVTTLLVLCGWGLWLEVLGACFLLLQQFTVCAALRAKLPAPADWIFRASWWRWFNDYWWLVVAGFLVLAPITSLVTYWVRHRLRSRLLGRAWIALFLAPPILLLGAAAFGMMAACTGAAHEIRADRDHAENYLTPDSQQLLSPVKLREIRQGLTGPDGAIVVIEPGGEWRIAPGLREWGRPPLRQGKLTSGQLQMLAEHFAREKFLRCCEEEEGIAPPAADPPRNRDALVIEFGAHRLTLEGVRREGLQQVENLEPWEADARSRFASLLLVMEDLLKPSGPD